MEKENSTLQRLLADAELEEAALKGVVRGNYEARSARRATVRHLMMTMGAVDGSPVA